MKKFIALALLTVSLFGAEKYERVEDKCSLKILTPALAERKTAKIRLSNGLEAYLISDPGAAQSAGALAVEAGSWQDPKEYPGMAHFLEHLLFMGTKKYPDESEYMKYMSDHGGNRNAYTASDRTCYMFSIRNDAFEGGLDRFAQFFIHPLFLPSCINRELNAVDQEYAKNIENDSWRTWYVIKETENQSHPDSLFSIGNAETLSEIPPEAFKKWYKEHYSANQMHFVAVSTLPLEEMIRLTVEKFSDVPNRHLSTPNYPQDLFSQQQKGHFIYIKPVKDVKTVSLCWQLPKEIALDTDTKACALLSYALKHEAENGLLEQLKRENLAEHISVDTDTLSSSCALFIIDISLTEAGLKQIDNVIARTFQTLNRLKETGIPTYIFEEKQKMAILDYEYQSRYDAFHFVSECAKDLMREKLETFPEKLIMASKYAPEMIQQTLKSLTPQSCVYLVSADPKLSGIEPNREEKWMHAAYTIKPISETQLLAWSDLKPHPHIDIPSRNTFLPDSLVLLSAQPSTAPALISHDDPLGKVFFQQDTHYLVPETAALFAIKTPQLNGSAKSIVLFDLYTRVLNEKLSSQNFYAHEAGLSASFQQSDFDFNIGVKGYSEKLPLYLQTIFQSMQDLSPTAAEFEIYKQSIQSAYSNASKELPFRQGMQLLTSLIYNYKPTPQAKLDALSTLSYEEFLSFLHEVFKTAYAEGMIYGNLSSADAEKIWSSYKTALHPAPFANHYKKGVLIPSENQGPYRIEEHTERQGNSVVLMLHQGSFSLENRAIQEVLSTALKDDFFDTLRTKQQTGYIAFSGDIEAERNLLQLFIVQSNTHHPSELLARFELFLEDYSLHIDEKISSDRFEILKASLIEELSQPPENLIGKASQLNKIAFEYDADFDWINKRIETAKSLTYETFCKASSTQLSRKNKKRIAVLMEGILPEKNQFRYELIAQDDVRGIGKYVSKN